ncbi:MAG: oxidoreductase, partial [Desulfobacterales bacterium]
LLDLGYSAIMSREKGLAGSDKLLLKEQWAGVVDTVGGELLANAIKATMFDGVVTSCGNAFSGDLPLTVYPFILRGVHLVGIYSANCPMEKRLMIWEKLAGQWKLDNLDVISGMISLEELPHRIDQMLAGKTKGRTVVRLWEEM